MPEQDAEKPALESFVKEHDFRTEDSNQAARAFKTAEGPALDGLVTGHDWQVGVSTQTHRAAKANEMDGALASDFGSMKDTGKGTGFSPYIDLPNPDGALAPVTIADSTKGTGFSPYITSPQENGA